MHFKILVLCAAVAIAQAGYLAPALRYSAAAPILSYAAPAPAIAYSAPAIRYAAPAVAHVQHLAPTYSLHKSEVYTAPLVRSAVIAPAVHSIAPAPLAAPLHYGSYLGARVGW